MSSRLSSGTWLYGRVDDDFSSTASGSLRDVLGEGILIRSMTLPYYIVPSRDTREASNGGRVRVRIIQSTASGHQDVGLLLPPRRA